MKTTTVILFTALFSGMVCAEMGQPEDIPEAGRIRIDGRLEDWRRAEWTPLTATLAGNPGVTDAEWSLCWDDDARVYIAVRYTDPNLVLQDSYVKSNAQDCVEIFVRGDNGSEPAEYAATQESAQHYVFGLSQNKLITWSRLGNLPAIPSHNPVKAAAVLTGNTFTYEIMVPLYDRFDASSRHRSSETEVIVDMEVGIDIAIVDVGSTGLLGIRSENKMAGKENNADHIAEHTLSD
jgi:hypothetical protein